MTLKGGEEAATAFAQLGNLKKMGEQPHPLASDVVGRRGWNGDDTVFRIEIDPLIILRVTDANHEVSSPQVYASGPVTLQPLHSENARFMLCARCRIFHIRGQVRIAPDFLRLQNPQDGIHLGFMPPVENPVDLGRAFGNSREVTLVLHLCKPYFRDRFAGVRAVLQLAHHHNASGTATERTFLSIHLEGPLEVVDRDAFFGPGHEHL